MGRDLIEAARLRNIVSDHQEFQATWNTFKVKYSCLPGDCPNATEYFGEATSCPTVDATGTCNGNGDGWVDYSGVATSESHRVWGHLHYSSLISYQGIADNGTGEKPLYDATYFVRAPNDNNAVWLVGSATPAQRWAQIYGNAGNNNFGSTLTGVAIQTQTFNSAAQSYLARVPVETSATTFRIDEKLDDGVPAAGKFRASGGHDYGTTNYTACVIGSGNTSSYDLNQTTVTCRYFLLLEN